MYSDARNLCKALKISRNTLTTYIHKAVPDKWELKKGYSKRYPMGMYQFTTEDYKLFFSIRELRKKEVPYKEIKKRMTKEFIGEEVDKMAFEDLKAFFTEGSNEVDEKQDTNKKIEPNIKLINVKQEKGQLLVSSREVANNFEKRNQHINEAIRDIERSVENSTHLFIPNEYKDSYGRIQNEYLLTRDGFSLLVMGFTGQKALQWKLKYIEAFNKMEKSLIENRASYMIQDPIERAKAWIEEQKERELLNLENKQQQQIIRELKPKSDYTDQILQSKSLVTITQIAKDYGMSGQAMNTLLYELGIQYKDCGQWFLYKKYQDNSYTQSKTYYYDTPSGRYSQMHTQWTQKGRLFLYELLKENGVLPNLERFQRRAING